MISLIKRWKHRKLNSDVSKVIIYPNGSFELPSQYLFKNKKQSLELLDKLNKTFIT